MNSDLLRELLQATLAASAAIVLLACMRRFLRARFGARLAYRAWLLVPLAVLAVLLPAARATAPLAGVGEGGGISIGAVRWSNDVLVNAPDQVAQLMLLGWATGAVLTLAWFAIRQRRFVRLLKRRIGSAFDMAAGQGPAVVGWWRARIVLPEDFRERYTRAERRLVLAHEVAHVRRGDIHAQALATGLRCLFWFNPLVHYAAALFRFDQELACDATVLERFPRARSRYGSAMLKTRLAGFGLPVGCHWQSSHPLKERIEMLKHPLPARARKISGAMLVAMLMSAGTYAAWAAQPAAPVAPKAAASEAKYLTRVTPEDKLDAPAYPAGAKVDGKVMLELLVGVDGKVKDVKVISSEPAGVFDQASIDAARNWQISPSLENGVPVERRVRVPIEFHPDGMPDSAAAKPPQA